MDSFNLVRKGYDPEEVDAYIYKLQEAIHNYQINEKAINQAIIQAEKAAQNIIAEAEAKAKRLEEDATIQLESLEKRLKQIRMKVDAFQTQYNQLLHRYIINMNNDDFSDLYDSIDVLSQTIQQTSKDHQKDSTDNTVIEKSS